MTAEVSISEMRNGRLYSRLAIKTSSDDPASVESGERDDRD